MRLFAALPVPETIAQALKGLQYGVPGAHWRPRENLHITLCFYGDVTPPVAAELRHELARINQQFFPLSLGEAGVFGGKEPRALWMGIAPNAALAELAQSCKQAGRKVGLAIERKTYIPHITLAYCNGTLDVDAARFMERVSGFSAPRFDAENFALTQSYLGTNPARYTPLEHYPLWVD